MTADIKQQLRTALGAAPAGQPPHSIEVEEAVLSALLITPDTLAEVAAIIEPSDFYIVRHEWVMDALLTIWRRADPVDYVTVVEELRTRGQLDEIGGAAFITHLTVAVPPGFNVVAYAELIQRLSDRRKINDVLRQRMQVSFNEEITVQQFYADTLKVLTDAKPRALDQALTPGRSIEARFMALQDQGEAAATVFPLPFGEPDQALPYMTGGKLFGIGGDEKTGKSALAETLSEHWAKLGLRGFYIHTEEKPDAKILRRYSRWSGIPFLKLEAGKLDASDLAKRDFAVDYAQPWSDNLDLWYESLPTPERVIALIRRAIQVFDVKFIVLDNFTDVDFTGRSRNTSQAQEAMKLLQQIDDLAARYGVLIVLVTQMTTQADGKRIAYGTSGFNKKMTWFWDINRKALKEPLEYHADGENHRLEAGAFDPRVDIYVPASRYGSGAKIEVFADLRRFYWRCRLDVTLPTAPPPKITHWTDRYDEPENPAQVDLTGF